MPSIRDNEQAKFSEPDSSVKILDVAHARIREGRAFTHNNKHTLAAGATHYHLFRTGGMPTILEEFSVTATQSPMDVIFYEGAVVSADGVLDVPLNHDRTSTRVSTSQLFSNPTVTNTGTQIQYSLITAGKNSGGSANTVGGAWILKTNTDYLLAVVNNSTKSADFEMHFFWHERA